MIRPEFDISPEQIADFCRRHHIRWLAVFGSALRDDFGPESDLDVLIEFEPGKTPGLAFFAMQDELSDLVGGRPVDLATVKELNRWIRGPVLRETRVLWSQDEGDGPRTRDLYTQADSARIWRGRAVTESRDLLYIDRGTGAGRPARAARPARPARPARVTIDQVSDRMSQLCVARVALVAAPLATNSAISSSE
ncbi:MAG: uncharacterized protein QOF01_4084 [Thermomicrobiales bacterium]|nr:uncharacterized protein [Thermomicrobiales bacterium]